MHARALPEPNQRARGAGEGYPPVWAATSFFRSPTVSSSLTVKVRFWKRERGRRGVRIWGGYFEARALEKKNGRPYSARPNTRRRRALQRPTDRPRQERRGQPEPAPTPASRCCWWWWWSSPDPHLLALHPDFLAQAVVQDHLDHDKLAARSPRASVRVHATWSPTSGTLPLRSRTLFSRSAYIL